MISRFNKRRPGQPIEASDGLSDLSTSSHGEKVHGQIIEIPRPNHDSLDGFEKSSRPLCISELAGRNSLIAKKSPPAFSGTAG
jgi:hypothetical protein